MIDMRVQEVSVSYMQGGASAEPRASLAAVGSLMSQSQRDLHHLGQQNQAAMYGTNAVKLKLVDFGQLYFVEFTNFNHFRRALHSVAYMPNLRQ